MNITITTDNHGDPVVHKTGCAHLKRLWAKGSTMEVASRKEAIAEFWSDFIEDGNWADFSTCTHFAPCLKALPFYEVTK